MRELIKAVGKRFDNATMAADYNGIWAWLAPQGVAMPYITITPGDVDVDYVMGSGSHRAETIPVTITAWLGLDTYTDRQPLDAILETYEDLIALFDDCALPMTGWHLVRFYRTGYSVGPDPDMGWRVSISYEAIIEEV